MNRALYIVIIVLTQKLISCAPGSSFTNRYYAMHKEELNSIRDRYALAYDKKPFQVQFKDKAFRHVSYEIITDSLRYIYNFDLEESSIADTLDKYHFDTPQIIGLIADMRAIRCTWITRLTYYENQLTKNMVFISVRDHRLESILNGEKYYALAYFNEPQLFDQNGKLIDKSDRKKLREINGAVFRRIDDRVCYAITGMFR